MSIKAAENVQKYLLFFSYLGKHYNGVQMQTRRLPVEETPLKKIVDNSIQLHLENALKTIKPTPINKFALSVSSRTDKGVNALVNTCHFHLQHPRNGFYYKPNIILKQMNKYLNQENHSIIARRAVPVHQLFSSRRHAISRTYSYRVAVIKKPQEFHKVLYPNFLLPINELDRCWAVCPTQGYLDIDKMREICDFLVGTHNFSAFQAANNENRDPERTILDATIKLIPESFVYHRDSFYKNIDFMEIVIKGKSFLYKQVRRIVGVLIAVGRGALDVNCVRSLLNDPESNRWKFITAPPSGLYLTDIEYDEKDFINPRIFNPELVEKYRNEAISTESVCESNESYSQTLECK